MNVYDHWQAQKPALTAALDAQTDLAGMVYEVRRALLQTEQNALAEMTDDVLRQQAGVLMSQLKTSVGLLESRVTATAWTPQRQADRPARRSGAALWTAAFVLQLLLGISCYLNGSTAGWVAALAALIASGCALLRERRVPAPDMGDELRITLKPDLDRLFSLLDGQARAIDRALNDLAYLNDQLRGGMEIADAPAAARAADLLEALYEYEGSAREAAEEAACRMLEGMGLCALDYSEENRRLFNALPSKTETRTLSPAIVSAQDRRLLRRGTAAVHIDAA